MEELEAEKDKLQDDLNLFMEQLEMTQANAKEQDVIAFEACKVVSISRCDYSHVLEYLSFLLEW